MMLATYRLLAGALGPLIDGYLERRVRRGKEDPARLAERRGVASRARPAGALIWFHAASVGEAAGLLTLVEALEAAHPDTAFLMTTGTVTSADAMAKRLPDRVIHQYVPVDRPQWVARFLDHWRPDLGVWMESDLWPTLVTEAHRRGVRLALVDGRLSVGAFQRWRRLGILARPLFAAFDLVLAASEDQARRFGALGCREVRFVGNLKAASTPPPVNDVAVAALRSMIGARPAWLAANTHPGEDAVVLDAHARLAPSRPGLLTVIVPRHVHRGDAIEATIRQRNLTVARRSRGGTIGPEADVYLADTMGELPAIYSAIPVTFLAGSIAPVGGHNPVEPAHCGTALLLGPHIPNNRDTADALLRAGAARPVEDADSLARAVADLLDDPQAAAAMAEAGRRVAAKGHAGLERIVAALAPLLPRRRR